MKVKLAINTDALRKNKAISSELPPASGWAPSHGFGRDSEADRRVGSCIVTKGRLQVCPAAGVGKLQVG